MSGYGQAIGYAKQTVSAIKPARKIRKQKVKLTLKQRFRNWLMNDRDEMEQDIPQVVEGSRLDSDGMRLQIYRANGGYVVETRTYDRHKDRNNNSMHIITDIDDLS